MGHTMVLRKWDASKAMEEINFSFSPFWVQVHGLPLGYLNVKSGEKIAPLLGDLVRVEDPEKEGRIARCLRLRIWHNLNNPLKKGFTLKRPNDEDLWVKFQYERLSDFCYGCGKIGHTVPECKPFRDVERSKWSYDGSIRAEISFLRTVNVGIRPPEIVSYPACTTSSAGGVTGNSTLTCMTKETATLQEEVGGKDPRTKQSGINTWQGDMDSYKGMESDLTTSLISSPKTFRAETSTLQNTNQLYPNPTSLNTPTTGPSYFVEEPDSPKATYNLFTNAQTFSRPGLFGLNQVFLTPNQTLQNVSPSNILSPNTNLSTKFLTNPSLQLTTQSTQPFPSATSDSFIPKPKSPGHNDVSLTTVFDRLLSLKRKGDEEETSEHPSKRANSLSLR